MKDPRDNTKRNCLIFDRIFFAVIIILIALVVSGILADLGYSRGQQLPKSGYDTSLVIKQAPLPKSGFDTLLGTKGPALIKSGND